MTESESSFNPNEELEKIYLKRKVYCVGIMHRLAYKYLEGDPHQQFVIDHAEDLVQDIFTYLVNHPEQVQAPSLAQMGYWAQICWRRFRIFLRDGKFGITHTYMGGVKWGDEEQLSELPSEFDPLGALDDVEIPEEVTVKTGEAKWSVNPEEEKMVASIDRKDLRNILQESVRLTPRQKRAIDMYYFQDFTLEEVGQIFHVEAKAEYDRLEVPEERRQYGTDKESMSQLVQKAVYKLKRYPSWENIKHYFQKPEEQKESTNSTINT